MIQMLTEEPSLWLDPDVCRLLFENFKNKLDFNEPIPPFSERFPGKLESILNSVSQTFEGEYLNGTVLLASSAYFNQFIRGHVFKNGNKRMALLFTHYFLYCHKIDFSLNATEMLSFALEIAKAGESGISAEETKIFCIKIISNFTKEG